MVVRTNAYVHGIILAGVHLWEDNAFNNIMPRPLLPVAQRPLVCYVLRWLRQAGIHQATICANSTSRFVRKYLASGLQWNMDLDYYEDWTPRGPAGCIRDAGLCSDADTHIIADGTIVPQVNLPDLLAAHERSKAWVTVVASPDPSNSAAGPAYLVPTGIYVVDRRALEVVGRTGYQDIKEVLIPRLHQAGHPVATYVTAPGPPRVCGFASYLELNSWLLQQMADPTYTILQYRKVRDCQIHCDAHVDPAAQLIGPVMVGAGAMVQPGATIVGPCVIGADCIIESDAVVCRSILWDRCQVGPQASLDRCVLTQDAYVEAGTRLYKTIYTPLAGQSHGLLGWLRRRRADAAGRHIDPTSPDTTAAQAGAQPSRRRSARIDNDALERTLA